MIYLKGNKVNQSNLFPLKGLVFYAPLNEASGTVYDIHGGVSSAGSGGLTYAQGGVIDQSILFSDSGGYVSMGDPTHLKLSTFTFSAWVYRTDTSPPHAVATIFSRYNYTGGSSNISYRFAVTNDKAQIAVRQSGTVLAAATGTTSLSATTWYHIVASHEVGGDIEIFVNSVSEASSSAVASIQYPTGQNVYIGSLQNTNLGSSPDFEFDGRIEQMCMWNRRLKQFEIDILYNSGNGTPYPLYYT